MTSKTDLLFIVTASLGVGTLMQLVNEHVDKTEKDTNVRVFKKIGLCAGAFAIGGMIGKAILTNNMIETLVNKNL